VSGELRDEGDRRLHALENDRVDRLHVLADEGGKPIQTRGGSAFRLLNLNDERQAFL
jgi:hypothetical protein